jgi:phage tail-like protein
LSENAIPLPVFQFQVNFDEETLNFSEVSGLNIEYEPITYKHGLSYKGEIQYIPGNRTPTKIICKKGIAHKSKALIEWIKTVQLNKVEKKVVTISMLDETGENELITWTLNNAFPTKLEGPSFNASSNELAIETIELIGDKLSLEHQ